MLKIQLAAFTVATALTSLTAFAQEDYTRFKSEASVQALGSFVKQTTQDGIDQGATNSAGVLATYRYYFSRHHGVEANYSRSEEHTSELQSHVNLVCRLLLEKKKKKE